MDERNLNSLISGGYGLQKKWENNEDKKKKKQVTKTIWNDLRGYRWLQNGYISNSKTLKSVFVSASVTVINSQTIKVGICNPENRQITNMVTNLP